MKMSPGRGFHFQPVEERRRMITPNRRRNPPKRMSDFPISEKAFIAIKILTSQLFCVKKRSQNKLIKKLLTKYQLAFYT